MLEFNVWDNKEIYQKYPKVSSAVLDYFMSESDISTRGKNIDFDINPNQYDDLDEWLAEEFAITPEMFYDSYHYFEELLKNAKFYTSDTGEVVIELSDDPVLNKIDNPKLDEITWMNLVDDSLAEFEDLTGVTAYTLGRSGRHVCVDFNLENLIGFDKLKDVIEKLQKQLIKDANNVNLDESFGYDTSVDDSTTYEINAKFNDDVDFDTKIVDRDELYSFVTKIAEINGDDEPENDIDAIITFLGDYDIYISQPKNKKSKEITLESVFTEPDEVVAFKKNVNLADDKEEIQFLIYELSDGVAEEACQVAFDTATNLNVNDIDAIKDEVISAIDMYLEDNEFNEAYQKLDASTNKKLTSRLADKYKTWQDVYSLFIEVTNNSNNEDIESEVYKIYQKGKGLPQFDKAYSVWMNSADTEEGQWEEVASKQVMDSDGFLTDYTMYTDGETYICMFGDKDLYGPDAEYADYETDDEKNAWDWFNTYEGFADDFEADEDDIFENINENSIYGSSYTPDILDELINFYSSQDTMSYADIWDEIFNTYHNEALADDVLDGLDDKNTTLEDVNRKLTSATGSITIDDSILKHSDEFKYRLLGRMQTDCNYFLGAGNRAEKFLWAGNVPEQIAYMRAIYNSFPDNKKPEWISLADIDEYEKKMLKLDESLDIDDELEHPEQEFDSAKTSINSNKLPAVYRMISIPKGSVGVDFGGGSFDNAVEYISDLGATLFVYDPYNRSAEHNKQVIRMLKDNGGADWAINSNVLNVIKEPSARRAVLENISKITKPGAPIYITVYEGRGDGKEGPTKSGYQLNRKTQDYLEDIQKVFPDATRKGKLITAHNTKSNTSSISENTDIEDVTASSDGYVYTYCDNCGKKNRVKVHFKDYFSPFDDIEYECEYCKGHNLLHDPHLYDDSGEIYGVETPDVLESTQKSNGLTSTKLIKLKDEILSIVKDVMMSPNFGFLEDEVQEYSFVDVYPEGRVEVRAEVDYDGLMELVAALNPIIKKYNKNSYFEPVEPGIIEAYI